MRELYDKDTIQKYLQEDIYIRTEEIIHIDDLIGQSTNIKLGINGDWGTGKSVIANIIYYASNSLFDENVISTCKNLFTNFMSEDRFVIYYDASKEDVFNNPLLSLVKVISNFLDKSKKFSKKDVFESLINVCLEVPNLAILARSVKEIKEYMSSDTYLDELYNTEFLIKKVKELFDENKKYVLIIDELDRCDPKYVLKLLNTIKHFFDLNNLAIIYFYNYDELWHLIKKEYGYENEQYLQKFIDYEIKLSPVAIYNFYDKKYDYYNIYLSICSSLYGLNPREINNLEYIYNLHNKINDKQDLFEMLVISHFLIKKLNKEDIKYELVDSKKEHIYNQTRLDRSFIDSIIKSVEKRYPVDENYCILELVLKKYSIQIN